MTWNIHAGGGDRIAEVSRYIESMSADIVVLTEFRVKNEPELRSNLQRLGYLHI